MATQTLLRYRYTDQEPLPQTQYNVTGVTFDTANIEVHGSGSDQWPHTWGSDGNIYMASGDGNGWSAALPYSTFIITRVTGALPPNPAATDVFNSTVADYKPNGIIGESGGRINVFYDTQDNSDAYDGSWGMYSTNNGVNWTDTDIKLFSRTSDGAIVVGVAQFGAGYTNVPSHVDPAYFYVYLSGRDDTDIHGPDVWLGRVLKANIFTRASYQFYTGLSGGVPQWSSTWASRVAVFSDPAGMAYHANVVWDSQIQKFIYAKFHKSGTVWVLCMYTGYYPWGPWTNFYYSSAALPNPTQRKFTVQTPAKWMGSVSGNQQTIWMTYSGWPELDSISILPITLSLSTGSALTVPLSDTWATLGDSFAKSLGGGVTRLGLHVTSAELAVWQTRSTSGPYKSNGDVSTNSPGDWDRIVSNKNSFESSPTSGRWAGPTVLSGG